MKTISSLISILCLMTVLNSCTGTRYNMLNEIPEKEKALNMSYGIPLIEKGQELCISVSALNEESAQFFRASRWREGATGIECLYYQVKDNGAVDIPILGEVVLAGLSLEAAEDKVTSELDHLLKEPHVRIEYVDFQVSVMGEVEQPGVFQFPGGRVTILEVIARAGGVTQFAKRGTVIVIRETPEGIKHIRLDLRKDDVLTSDYYYLHHEDLVMLDSNPARVANAHNITTLGSVLVGFGTIAAILSTR